MSIKKGSEDLTISAVLTICCKVLRSETIPKQGNDATDQEALHSPPVKCVEEGGERSAFLSGCRKVKTLLHSHK